jgi:hypothetical protein
MEKNPIFTRRFFLVFFFSAPEPTSPAAEFSSRGATLAPIRKNGADTHAHRPPFASLPHPSAPRVGGSSAALCCCDRM